MTITGCVLMYGIVLPKSQLKEVMQAIVHKAKPKTPPSESDSASGSDADNDGVSYTVKFSGGKSLVVGPFSSTIRARDLGQRILELEELPLSSRITLLDGDRQVPESEILKGTDFTAVQHQMTSEELDEYADDGYEVGHLLGKALGLDFNVCPHDLSSDETVVFFGTQTAVSSGGGPFAGMPNVSFDIKEETKERVSNIIQSQVLPALKAPEEAQVIGGYRVVAPKTAQYYVWPNDCGCCS
eukprot:TRINITY_DN14545_c0_g4_i1.p1 TRINITY_DN14545_c0_g4~~TRINITY_DN14545_c0_g4_i1.p1  ORF type:complete len:260 (+),score=22.06 TRINITY_DN14545_c0_g4_i1:58-780(+)